MNFVQSRHRLDARSRDEMERYVVECEKLTAHDYYALPTQWRHCRCNRRNLWCDRHLEQSGRDKISREQHRRADFFHVLVAGARRPC